MKTFKRIALGILLFPLTLLAVTVIKQDAGGLKIGTEPTQKLGFYGAAPVTQRTNSAQAAIALSFATGTLTIAVQPTSGDTITLGSVTYTFQSSVSTTANKILIGAAATNTLANALAAINAAAGGGTTYGSATVANPSASAAAATSTTITVSSFTPGTAGNTVVASTSSFTSGSNHFGATTLGGATDPNGTTNAVLLNELRQALVSAGLIKGQ